MNHLLRKRLRQKRIEKCRVELEMYPHRLLDIFGRMGEIERQTNFDIKVPCEPYLALLDERERLALDSEIVRAEIEVLSIEEHDLHSARQEIQSRKDAAVAWFDRVKDAPTLDASTVAELSRFPSELRRADAKLKIIDQMLRSIPRA
ncbi:hypothetical protein J2X76_005427 [Neorhizobium sp. 2083]|uniref:hypothetical protein n=1 Tax=Neorhizobium sp. 2083 TaxID=2817762 RepID=UPI002865BF8B|nr:hypothetical protein [Neorhizobium sp. 2083]MDR6820230.1 hypothetical protein [Neorhizobium sp. 2083]